MFCSKLKLLLIYSFITILAFVCVELFVRIVLEFPTLGFVKSYHIYPKDKSPNAPVFENKVLPHSSYYSTEDGYHVYRKNNLGLQGTDVTLEKQSKYIYVTGNSFVEARASKPEDISTSVFMGMLHKHISKDYQVVNVGLGGTVPYENWCRLQFWQKKIKPDYVILILTDGTMSNIMNSPQYEYVLPANFGMEVKNWKFDMVKVICNNSAFANLLRVNFRKSGITVATNKVERIFFRPYDDYIFSPESYNALLTTLVEFKKTYGDSFMCFSLMNNTCNRLTAVDCKRLGINFAYDGHLKNTNAYIIEGGAHYTREGNQVLGKDIYNAFHKFYR